MPDYAHCYTELGDLFKRIGRDARQVFVAGAAAITLPKGRQLFSSDDPADSVYVLLRGRVKVFCLAAEGKEMILWFCAPGELFGLAATRGDRRGVCARACERAELLSMPRERFQEFLLRYPAAALDVMDTLSQRVRTLGDTVQNLAATCVTGRVANLLQRLDAHGDGASGSELPLTHQDIADMVGCCRQSVTETLRDLKRTGAIACRRSSVRVVDIAALRAAAISPAPP